jgi:hypothetical protein
LINIEITRADETNQAMYGQITKYCFGRHLKICRFQFAGFCSTARITHITKDVYYSNNYDCDDNDYDNNNNNETQTSGLSEPSDHYVWLQASYSRRTDANS